MPPFNPGDHLLAQWTPSHEQLPRWLDVSVIETVPSPFSTPSVKVDPTTYYRVQTNMGITMVLPESALCDFPESRVNGEP